MTDDEADRYILLQQMPFSGSLTSHYLSEPVAEPLLTLTDVQLEVWRFIAEEEKEDPASTSARIRVAYTVSQLICINASKQSSCHRNKRDNTFCLYVGLSLHATD